MEIKLAPPNSILFVSDPIIGQDEIIPELAPEQGVVSSGNCIAIGTLAEMDGETTVVLENNIAHPRGKLIFEGAIETPSRSVQVSTSQLEVVGRLDVSEVIAHFRIFTNDLREPDLIEIEAR